MERERAGSGREEELACDGRIRPWREKKLARKERVCPGREKKLARKGEFVFEERAGSGRENSPVKRELARERRVRP